MRYEPEHKQQTRAKILRVAGRAIRAQGPHRVGVAEVMAKAGLTHGGFYAHFKSKDDLVSAAIEDMFASSRAGAILDNPDKSAAEALADYIDVYLGPAHRDAPATGCPMAALAADLPRLSQPARERFAFGVAGIRARVARKLAEMGHTEPATEAASMVSEMVGALSLARAESDPATSDALLGASRAALKRRLLLEPK